MYHRNHQMLQIRDRFIIIFDYLDLESDRKNFSNAVLKVSFLQAYCEYTKKWGHTLLTLKNYHPIQQGSHSCHQQWSEGSNIPLCSSTFILLTDLNENINQHLCQINTCLSISILGWLGIEFGKIQQRHSVRIHWLYDILQ